MTARASRPLGLLVLLGVLVAAPASAQTNSHIMAGIFTTPFHDDAPDDDPWGLRAAAVFGPGIGVEGRWAHTDPSDYWSVGLIKMLPGVYGAKTIQPFGSVGAGRLERSGERITIISVAGGVVTFIGRLGLGVDFRYIHGTDPLAGEDVRERHVSFELLWRF